MRVKSGSVPAGEPFCCCVCPQRTKEEQLTVTSCISMLNNCKFFAYLVPLWIHLSKKKYRILVSVEWHKAVIVILHPVCVQESAWTGFKRSYPSSASLRIAHTHRWQSSWWLLHLVSLTSRTGPTPFSCWFLNIMQHHIHKHKSMLRVAIHYFRLGPLTRTHRIPLRMDRLTHMGKVCNIHVFGFYRPFFIRADTFRDFIITVSINDNCISALLSVSRPTFISFNSCETPYEPFLKYSMPTSETVFIIALNR